MPKITILRYEYHGKDGHYIQVFLDGVATWGGHDQRNGRVKYDDILKALVAADIEEIDLSMGERGVGLTSDFDPGYYGYDDYDDGVTYTGVNKR